MGIANHHMFNLREAQKDYEKALRLKPTYPEALNNLGAVYYGQKLYRDAEKSYKKAIKLSPKAAMFYSNLGTAYLAEGKFKKGEQCYRTALALDPNVLRAIPQPGLPRQARRTRSRRLTTCWQRPMPRQAERRKHFFI